MTRPLPFLQNRSRVECGGVGKTVMTGSEKLPISATSMQFAVHLEGAVARDLRNALAAYNAFGVRRVVWSRGCIQSAVRVVRSGLTPHTACWSATYRSPDAECEGRRQFWRIVWAMTHSLFPNWARLKALQQIQRRGCCSRQSRASRQLNGESWISRSRDPREQDP